MSVDNTIEELSGTLAQLGILVKHINAQIVGISARVNVTLDNFDRAVEGIAKDAGLMTGQVGDTVSQIPSSWVFYVLFISLIVVLALLSILIIINLIARICVMFRDANDENLRLLPLSNSFYTDKKQQLQFADAGATNSSDVTSPFGTSGGGGGARNQMCAVPMEAEPKRYGGNTRPPPPQHYGVGGGGVLGGGIDNASYTSPTRLPQAGGFAPTDIYLTKAPPYNFQEPQQRRRKHVAAAEIDGQHYHNPRRQQQLQQQELISVYQQQQLLIQQKQRQKQQQRQRGSHGAKLSQSDSSDHSTQVTIHPLTYANDAVVSAHANAV